ncbi:uncharacterized protein [Cardiocondyla obscurior]|uniref:uncharacterized protein n=1 Tax=Cardiocondyla obscurior TaxID=286306 RepID=UPI0039657807
MELRFRTLEAIQTPGRESSTNTSIGRESASRSTLGTRGARALVTNATPPLSGGKPNQSSLCSGQHYILACPEFKRKGAVARKEAAVSLQLCFNYFGHHRVNVCPSTRKCPICKERHHSTIHEVCFPAASISRVAELQQLAVYADRITEINPAPPAYSENSPAKGRAKASGNGAVALHLRGILKERKRVLLATAKIFVKDRFGKLQVARALIDPGSKVLLVSKSLMQRLQLLRESDSTSIFGIGGHVSSYARGRVLLNIESDTKTLFSLQVSALILPRVTVAEINFENYANKWSYLSGLKLADPDFTSNLRTEIILGAAVYAIILEDGIRKGSVNSPVAVKTSIGWILFGTAGGNSLGSGVAVHHCNTGADLSPLVSRFWQQEEIARTAASRSPDDQKCEEFFVKTHRRNESGRYVIRLPFKTAIKIAIKMFHSLEKRLDKQSEICPLYNEFMQEYENLEHMSMTSSTAPSNQAVCYLPHHCVIKPARDKIKLRVVFNGSAQLDNNASLNKVLLSGENLLPQLPTIITNWRRHRLAIATDIEKMYQQILIETCDRYMQRIV